MSKKLINLLSLVLILCASTAVQAEEFELFDRLKDDMWNMGLDFEYVHTSDFKLPTGETMTSGDNSTENIAVNSVPYDLIERFERTF